VSYAAVNEAKAHFVGVAFSHDGVAARCRSHKRHAILLRLQECSQKFGGLIEGFQNL
jgi:hypothetical protein